MPVEQNYNLDPIPIPKEVPVQVNPQKDQQGGGGEEMPAVYRGGKAGGAAFIADKVLTGWLAGRKVAHEREHEKMVQEVNSAKTGLDVIGQSYKAAVESGDPKRIEDTKRALSEAYKDYLDKAEKYALPDDVKGADGKKKGGGVKAGLKKAFMGEPEHLNIAHSTLEVLRKSDPTAMYGPSKQEQQQQALTAQELENSKKRSKIADLDINDREAAGAARKDYEEAVNRGDVKAQDAAAKKLEAWGTKIRSTAEREVQEKLYQNAKTGSDALASGKQLRDLPDDQRAALITTGLATQMKGGVDAYLQDKRFKTPLDAVRAYDRDQAVYQAMGARPNVIEDLAKLEKTKLQHELQDPEKAKKYGLDKPLKPGENPPAWLVAEQTEKRYKESDEDKAAGRMAGGIAVNKSVARALKTFSDSESMEIQAKFLIKDPDTGFWMLNPNPDLSQSKDPTKERQLYKTFRNRAVTWSKQLYKGATDEAINEQLGPDPFDPALEPPPVTMRNRRGGYGLQDSELEPLPGNKTAGADLEQYPPHGKYVVKRKGGKALYGGQPVEFTGEQASKLAANGYQLETQ